MLGRRMMMAAAGASGGGKVASVSNTDNDTLTESLRTVATHSSMSFGAAPGGGETRQIIAIHMNCQGAAARSVSSMTIGGQTASFLTGSRVQTGTPWCNIEAWIATVPSGTSGDVVVTKSGSSAIDMLGVFRLIDGASTADNANTDSSTSDVVLSLDVTSVADGVIVAMAANTQTGTPAYAWTGATVDFNTDGVGNSSWSGASEDTSTATATTVEADPDAAPGTQVGCAVAIGPET